MEPVHSGFLVALLLMEIIIGLDGNSQRKDAKAKQQTKKQQDQQYSNLTASSLLASSDALKVVESGRTDEQRLLDGLFHGYDHHARPVVNFTNRVTISMSLTITQIFELDEKNQVLIVNAWVNLEWIDQYLVWDPDDFSGLKMVRILSSKLWRPDIVLYNNAADFSPGVLETRAMVTNDGLVFWSQPTKMFSSCKIDVTYFPFDEQLCRMKFGSWTYDGFKVDLVNSSTTADLSLYVKSGEWDLISAEQIRHVVLYTCCVEPYPDVTFYIHIKRKPLYYTINVFMPCLIMSALTLLVFQLPAESGEKCGLGIVLMLGFAMLMLNVVGKLPETSESYPLITIYMTAAVSATAFCLVITVAVLNLNYKSSRSGQVKPWLKALLDAVSPICVITVATPSLSAPKCNDKMKRCISISNCAEDSGAFVTASSSNNNNNSNSGAVEQEVVIQAPTTSSNSSSTTNSSSFFDSNMAITPEEILRLLTFEFDETVIQASIGSGDTSLSASYQEIAFGLHQLLEREQEEAKTQESLATWRRLAQLVDRSLFWVMLCVISFFTVFLLVIAPSEKLL